jgi:hypothetical protein
MKFINTWQTKIKPESKKKAVLIKIWNKKTKKTGDIMEITAGLAALKSITTGIAGVNKLLTAIKDTQQHQQLLELKEALLTTKEESLSLREEVITLRSKLANKESLIFDKGADAYYKQIAGTEKEGPFCKTCWDIDSKLLWLNKDGWCAGCKQGYGPEYNI